MASQAFKRSNALFQKIAEIKAQNLPKQLTMALLTSLPGYRSRGKGLKERNWEKMRKSCFRIPKATWYPAAKAESVAAAKKYNEGLRNGTRIS